MCFKMKQKQTKKIISRTHKIVPVKTTHCWVGAWRKAWRAKPGGRDEKISGLYTKRGHCVSVVWEGTFGQSTKKKNNNNKKSYSGYMRGTLEPTPRKVQVARVPTGSTQLETRRKPFR